VVIKDVSLPETLIKAIARQAEAERERRSRIIIAQAEQEAAQKMGEAAEIYVQNPLAMKLREFQMITDVSIQKNLVLISVERGSMTNVAETAAIAKALDKKGDKT
jgi:regulator of protease activity HflC (stomatin/prohibitin superfamily)